MKSPGVRSSGFMPRLNGLDAGGDQFGSLQVTLEVTFRLCEKGDLRRLEWEGLFSSHRRIIQAAFRRQERGQNLMILAEANGMLAGQVWLDLERTRKDQAALIWAMRVVPWWQGLGIGARLLDIAAGMAAERQIPALQLLVDQKNVAAQRLYQRSGFEIVGQLLEFEPYTTRTGRTVKIRRPRYLMKKQLHSRSNGLTEEVSSAAPGANRWRGFETNTSSR
jgi:ribosomal protein S18 acetylase RimI-like enzyme